MRKEIVIGGNKAPNYNGRILWTGAEVSENNDFYIFHQREFNYCIFVVKESDFGKTISDWIKHEDNRNNSSVRAKYIEMLLPRITPEEFTNIIENKKAVAYRNGYADAQRDIRKALGINEFGWW